MSIIVTDELDDLKVYHYNVCDLSSPDTLKDNRGIIKINDNILCKTFGFTPEISSNDPDNITTHILPVVETSTFYHSHEGTILRLWFHTSETPEKSKWFLSTHRKINAFTSKWGSNKSYGELFTSGLSAIKVTPVSWADYVDDDVTVDKQKNVFDNFCLTCDKSLIYTFLVRNTDSNRVVVRGYTTPEIYCLGVFDKEFKYHLPPDNFVFKRPELYKYTSVEQLVLDVNALDIYKYGGYLLVTNDGKLVKFMNHAYFDLFKVRQNTPNISVRYLETRHSEEETDKLIQLYPEFKIERDIIENIILDISNNVYKKYKSRYIFKNTTFLPPCQYKILTELHKLYLSKLISKIKQEDVTLYINNMASSDLYNIIKNYKHNLKLYGNGNFISDELKTKILNSKHR